MGFFRSKKGSIISDYFVLLTTIGNFEAGNTFDVALYEDHLELSTCLKKNKVLLSYSQITDVFYGVQKELEQKKKSVIGRAAVGGLLFGGFGSTVGAISALNGKKQTTVYKKRFIISYTNANGEESFLQFEDRRNYKGKKVANTLKALCHIEDPEKKDIRL